MNMRFAAIGALLGGALSAQPAGADDLMDVYRMAREQDPTIREAMANYRASREALPQARAGLLPTVTLNATRDDRTSSGTQFTAVQDPVTGETTFALDTFEVSSDSTSFNLELRQPLFRWDRIQAWSKADYDVAQAEARYKNAQQELIVRTAEAYFNVLNAEAELEAVEANKTALKRQLEQTQKRFDVGLIAVTDVQEAKAAYDRAVADHIAAERQLSTAKENLQAIVGSYPGRLARPEGEVPLEQPEPQDADAWAKRALDDNLGVAAKRFEVMAAGEEVDRVRAGHYPTLDLVARKTDSETNSTNIFQVGDTEQDYVAVQFSLPLFEGGSTQSRVRQAAHQRAAQQEALTRVQRNTVRDARDAYLGVLSEISRVKALRQAVESSKTALEATTAGLEVGTRTTVDVLDARRGLVDAQRNFAQARYNYLLNTLKLKAAAGSLTEADLKQINDWFTAGSDNPAS